ncbi:ATP-dependent RNA helicase DDX56/DBP9 [Strigomonas culicis]|uniref:RNA helicase n=1 Tax=Strigomonas culicis TaxID=28005 RepID=S9UEK2_9TRYP|nr:ATP-dependent RNA helicase DDX56/DBP9 [Strigomonas culicis]|eukprot:EPY29237.1 ATP-dependent RNA helicase DDX56/DBP9 [Strigomonas culicis]
MVMDEADIVVSSAEHSLRTVQSVLPPSMQVVLSSATLTDGVATIKGQLLHNPTNIVLTAESVRESAAVAADNGPLVESRIVVKEGKKDTLKQFYLVSSDECHHYTLLYSLYRFALINGKTLVFVDEDDQTYKLQHFLESMGVATLVYDASLPINVRLDTLRRFQSGTVSTLVCTDGTLESAERLCGEHQEDRAQEKTGKKKRARDEGEDEAPSALHRGIDFSNVKNVILFNGVDASSSTELSRYTHRVGRTARAGAEGISITFFSVPQARRNLSEMRSYCESKGTRFRPFKKLQRAKAAKLQYRVDSVLSSVTRNATRKLRVATVAAELNRSSYLAQHMSQRDTDALRRIVNRSKDNVKIEPSVLDVPEYMKLNVDEVKDFTRRVRADQTRSSKFKKATKKKSEDPLKAVAAKIRAKRKKK